MTLYRIEFEVDNGVSKIFKTVIFGGEVFTGQHGWE